MVAGTRELAGVVKRGCCRGADPGPSSPPDNSSLSCARMQKLIDNFIAKEVKPNLILLLNLIDTPIARAISIHDSGKLLLLHFQTFE